MIAQSKSSVLQARPEPSTNTNFPQKIWEEILKYKKFETNLKIIDN